MFCFIIIIIIIIIYSHGVTKVRFLMAVLDVHN